MEKVMQFIYEKEIVPCKGAIKKSLKRRLGQRSQPMNERGLARSALMPWPK
jgi:hypothetical protein